MLHLSATLTNAVFVYLCICICIFASQTPGNIVFEVLVSLPFQKYSTCHVYLQLWPMLYLYICVFVFVHLQVRYPGILFLRSWYHYLSENIWFLWSKTLHNWENLRCHACDGHTHTHTCEFSAVFHLDRIFLSEIVVIVIVKNCFRKDFLSELVIVEKNLFR